MVSVFDQDKHISHNNNKLNTNLCHIVSLCKEDHMCMYKVERNLEQVHLCIFHGSDNKMMVDYMAFESL